MATFLENAVNSMFSVIYLFVILVISHFGFANMGLVLIVPVPGHCLHFSSDKWMKNKY